MITDRLYSGDRGVLSDTIFITWYVAGAVPMFFKLCAVRDAWK
jgi:hypothetical protein